MIPNYSTPHSFDYNPEFHGEFAYKSKYQGEANFNPRYADDQDYNPATQTREPTKEEIELWELAGGNREGVSFGRRVALAATHFCHIPESILNLITNVVKLVFTAIACAFSFGQVDLLNNEFRLALGRTMINFAGIGIHTVGVVAPVTALKWQMNIVIKTTENLKGNSFEEGDNPNVLVPMMMSI
ncbi:hypothetical protein [Estrella lausannensis]|uniref:Putative membrane protein n=1 Tax=Estrella lausannensis TaxID=483423 RepID=A0A0H5DP29_9BACT|nr:hypothetical protein [Estrella lausannensis]CRX38097.1 putative membrane protein [Estrella lausannensis]